MLKLLKLLAWVVLSLVLLGAFDQFMVRVPLDLPGVAPAQTFYVDFRSRLLGLAGFEVAGKPDRSIEQVIEANSSAPVAKPQGQRYLYVDDAGALQFADSLQQVPQQYRQRAEPLAE